MIFLAITVLTLMAQLTAPPIHGPYVCCFPSGKSDYCLDRDGSLIVRAAAADNGAEFNFIRRKGYPPVQHVGVVCADYDVSADGKRWFHLIGDACISGEPPYRNRQ